MKRLFSFPLRLIAVAAFMTGLTACEMPEYLQDMPVIGSPITYPCPQVIVAPNTEHMTVYRDDIAKPQYIDIIQEGTINARVKECEWDLDSKTAEGELNMAVIPEFEVYRGRANKDGTVTLPYFVSLLDGDKNPISKQNFVFKNKFPGAGRKATFIDAPTLLTIPVKSGQNNRDFIIMVGYQLTKQQWLDNKRKREEELK